ncbi:MAG: hypothetical protein BLM47_03565 [Candidatus Reconcilbacillus cellulovorans]|uniref:Spore cortex biosynthesis protein YabQ n=1 Tax=Candidatus Reconcilbacillus cellulovorans TaxID=1906605 RepID=A0A2A6E2P3_9BACL|nr:MAG: hypothetical protein BLM47_03565 [Candidatus Reconcilbacillus cellulovorans]
MGEVVPVTLGVQFAVMLAMIGCGAGLAAWLDIGRLAARRLGAPRAATAMLDAALWTVAAAPVFAALYFVNGGEIRVYVWLALGIGWCLYFSLFAGIVRRSVSAALSAVAAVLRAMSAVARIARFHKPRKTG